MYFQSWADFFAMGGHGPYVWSAYALVLASVVGLHLYARLRHRALTRQLQALKSWENNA